jgi:hypothetical protein
MGYRVVGLRRGDFTGDPELLKEKLKDAGAVINLAGAPIAGRWTPKYKKEIMDSRTDVTRKLADAVTSPLVFISASAVGIYPDGEMVDETCKKTAGNYLSEVCTRWETEAAKLPEDAALAIMRLGVVLDNKGGALPKMLLPFRLGLGGPIAGGQQGFSWIHIDDLINAFVFVLERRLTGIFNLTAPEVTDNLGFTQTLGKVLHRPVIMPLPAFALKLAFGEGAQVLTDGQKAVPARLKKDGFVFQFPELKPALAHLLM